MKEAWSISEMLYLNLKGEHINTAYDHLLLVKALPDL